MGCGSSSEAAAATPVADSVAPAGDAPRTAEASMRDTLVRLHRVDGRFGALETSVPSTPAAMVEDRAMQLHATMATAATWSMMASGAASSELDAIESDAAFIEAEIQSSPENPLSGPAISFRSMSSFGTPGTSHTPRALPRLRSSHASMHGASHSHSHSHSGHASSARAAAAAAAAAARSEAEGDTASSGAAEEVIDVYDAVLPKGA